MNRPLHIAYLCEEYPPNLLGGIGVFIQTLGRSLVRKGHKVTVCGPWREARRRNDHGVEIREFRPSAAAKLGWVLTRLEWGRQLRAIHEEKPIDIIECMDWQGFFTGVERVLPKKVARVVRLQGSQALFAHTLARPEHKLTTFLERRTLRSADHIVGITRFAYDVTLGLFPELSATPHSIIPNPVDAEAFHPRLNGKTEEGLVMFVGTLTAKKGVAELLAAWPMVLRECPAARLELAAKDTTDPSTGKLWSEVLLERLPPEAARSYLWRGPIDHDELPEMMARASVCVFPSHMETQSIVACESMALGKPTIFSRTGPGPEILIDGESGMLVSPHDPSAIAKAIVFLLKNPLARQEFGKNARKRAEELFSLSAIGVRNEELYESLAR